MLSVELFSLRSEAQFSFFQYNCAQQFHLRYGAHDRFLWPRGGRSGGCLAVAASASAPAHHRDRQATPTEQEQQQLRHTHLLSTAPGGFFFQRNFAGGNLWLEAIAMTLNTGKFVFSLLVLFSF